MTDFKFNQDVLIKGKPGTFLGYMRDGHEALVAIKPNPQRSNYCQNVVIPLGEIAPLIRGSSKNNKKQVAQPL